MKSYYEKLGKIGVVTVNALRKLDTQHRQNLDEHWKGVLEGKYTRSSYDDLKIEQDNERNALLDSMDDQMDQLLADYCNYTAESLAPNGSSIDAADAETLRNFKLTPAELDMLAEKHARNNTMLRLLNDYRKQHGINSEWRYQDGQTRIEGFKMAIIGVSALVRQKDEVNPYRLERIPQTVNRAYHATQGAYADQNPMPEAQVDIPVMRRGVDMGATIFSNLATGGAATPETARNTATGEKRVFGMKYDPDIQKDPVTGEYRTLAERRGMF